MHANPVTQSGLPNPTMVAQTFAAHSDNPQLTVIIQSGFDVLLKSSARFFGTDRVANITFSVAKTQQGPTVQTIIPVTIHATLPDDGTVDHFAPTADPPTNQ